MSTTNQVAPGKPSDDDSVYAARLWNTAKSRSAWPLFSGPAVDRERIALEISGQADEGGHLPPLGGSCNVGGRAAHKSTTVAYHDNVATLRLVTLR